jgi:hypothetical protein
MLGEMAEGFQAATTRINVSWYTNSSLLRTEAACPTETWQIPYSRFLKEENRRMFTGAPIMLGRCPPLSEHESESMLRTYLVCREKQANSTWEKHTVY